MWNVEIPLCLIRCMESEGLDTFWGVGDELHAHTALAPKKELKVPIG